MAYVFTEYIPGELDLFPDRNPLTEVRWWGFLTGDAYANPFHDLLYAVSRSATAGPGAAVGKRTAEFTADRLILTEGDGTTVTYSYAGLELLKLNHTGFQDNASFQLGTYHTQLEYRPIGGSWQRVALKMSQLRCQQLIRFLYEHRVDFREYFDGMRTYQLNTNVSYDRIQELKAKYGIKW